MLRAIYPLAVQSGIDSEEYWELNFEELMVQIIANNRNRVQALRERAVMDYKQSEMMAFALNDPSKMPKLEEAYPFLQDEVPSKAEPISDWQQDQMELMKQAQKIKTIRKLKNE